MLVSEGEDVADLERESLLDILGLPRGSVASRVEEDVRKINTDDLVSESCQRDCLRALPASSVEHPEGRARGWQVGGDLNTHELLAYGVADHSEAGEPRLDSGREGFLRRDGSGHGSGPYGMTGHFRPVPIAANVSGVSVGRATGEREGEPTEGMWCNVLASSDV